MTQFTDLGLAQPLLRALQSEGYDTPTPIQAQAIPTVMTGKDLLGIAQTGTGKTAAFALPILHRLAADKQRPPRRLTPGTRPRLPAKLLPGHDPYPLARVHVRARIRHPSRPPWRSVVIAIDEGGPTCRV